MDVLGFCLCPKPRGQSHKGMLRLNLLTGPGDLDNPAHKCLSCGSTYSAAGF
jgi:hypothetical protein